MTKPKDALHKGLLKTATSKNAFQNGSFKITSQYCSLKKCTSIKHFEIAHVYFKSTCQIAPSKNVFQNCYYKDIFISASISSLKDKTVL